ncbi:threonine-phosphate decarboxylase CobD [Ruminococcus sp. OA3]|uniref:threonine-phosphate decarboxylase CobD n=1 Tax=Ruminococcus sp. OA3 TaxID=2914164 RepID=UPI001F067AF2|nr:threonine-phosphate decarboxylase CobD [Ruminococcus sp. OA3]MCH1983632.1 threonine-phosphate decarboxylase CobD [Ruminococcus sp. OA3]
MKQIHGGDVYRHPDALDFSSNINPLGTPKAVIAAAAESLEKLEHYPDVFYTELREAIASYEEVVQESVICGNGAAELIFSLVRAVNPKKAMLPAPTFAEYRQALEAVDCGICTYFMEDFRVGEDILEKLDENLDMLFLCNPNNPTGFLIEPQLMCCIMEKCRRCGIFLMIDECFLDFAEHGEAYTMKGELSKNPEFFILKAFTKRYAMAGIRLGYGLSGSPGLLEKMERMTQPWNVSIPAQAAGCAALKEKEYVRQAQRLVNEQREFLKREMGKLPLSVYDSKANYIFFKGPVDLYERCLEKGILIRDCSNYPGLESGFFRIAVRMPEENERLLSVLGEVL